MKRSTFEGYRTNYRKYLLPHLGNTKLSQLTVKKVQEWVDCLVYDDIKPKNPPTIDRSIVILKLILTEAQREQWIGQNVVKMVPPRRPVDERGPRDIPSKECIRKMLKESSGKIGMVIHMAVFTGMRLSEICGLTWDHVDFQKGMIHVCQRIDHWGQIGPPKTKASNRHIPIAPTLLGMLKEWYLGCPKGEDNPNRYVILSQWKLPYPPSTVYTRQWCPLMTKIGMVKSNGRPICHFHDLRHVAASLWIEQRLPAKQVQTLMGHASIQITYDVYGHLFDDGDRRTAITAVERDILG